MWGDSKHFSRWDPLGSSFELTNNNNNNNNNNNKTTIYNAQ